MNDTPNAIFIYGTKNTNKSNKPLKFPEFEERGYWVNPMGFEWGDPDNRILYFENNIVFRVPGNGAIGFDNIIGRINQ